MDKNILNLLDETRKFPPSAEFKSRAHIANKDNFVRDLDFSRSHPQEYWAKQARILDWFKDWDSVLKQGADNSFSWFDGALLNASYNCIDRHLPTKSKKAAILWEGEPGDKRTLSFEELHASVCKFANVLEGLGVGPSDVVTVYMPMLPELLIAMQACARIGALHNVVFAGFSAQALRERIEDSRSKLVITADGGYRKGRVLDTKETVDKALEGLGLDVQVVVVERAKNPVSMIDNRDFWWHELMVRAPSNHLAPKLSAEHPLFLLYTSGSTGKPKGILHTTAGYLLHTTLSSKLIFDLHDDDIFWCSADAGWVTGHSYVCYGPLANGTTILIYEGAPNCPDWGRFWRLIENYQVSKFYTAPTAIRAFMKQGEEIPGAYNLTSLKLLGTVGEPINPEAWMWFNRVIGKGNCPIVDTWWQTETGGIMLSPLPGVTDAKPGSVATPFFGVDADVVDDQGRPLPPNVGGNLVIRSPWPGMLRGIHGDKDRYIKQYWSDIPGVYFTGDEARRDEDGFFWILGRIDDVLNVSGHRLSTMELESSLVSHPAVAEAAVVGAPHEIKGEAIAAFVSLEQGRIGSDELLAKLKAHVTEQIGAIARPDQIYFVDALPKTRSGKIMRRVLRSLASGQKLSGDLSTLEDRQSIEDIAAVANP